MVLKFMKFALKKMLRKIALTIAVMLYVIWITVIPIEPPLKKEVKNTTRLNHFSCHYKKDQDALPVIDSSMTIPPDSIFFIKSNCKFLNWREACSVESAARANPERQVNLFFSSPISFDILKSGILSTLLSMANIRLARIHLKDYAEKTSLYEYLKEPLTDKDLNMDINDIFKFLTMFKYSGTYLPLDVIFTNSFKSYEANWVIKKSNVFMFTDMFSFSNNKNGRDMAILAFGILQSHFVMTEQYFDSSKIMKKLMSLWCGTLEEYKFNTTNCKGLQVIGPNHVVPISLLEGHFETIKEVEKWEDHRIFSSKVWFNRPSRYEKSLSKKIAQEYCPLVDHFYGYKIST